MIKCKIITGTSYTDVEVAINRFLASNNVIEIVKVVNLSDEMLVAMAIYYKVT